MPELGLRFKAELVEVLQRELPEIKVNQSNVGQQIAGSRTIPVEQIEPWQRALQLVGVQAAEFDVAVRLTHSDEKIRDLIARQDLELATARAAMRLYEERIEIIAASMAALNGMRLRRIAQDAPTAPATPPVEPQAG